MNAERVLAGQIKYKNHINIGFFPGGINNYVDSDGTWGNYQGPHGYVPDAIYEEALRFVGRTDLLISNNNVPNYDFLYQIYTNHKNALNMRPNSIISSGTSGSYNIGVYDRNDYYHGR